MFAWDASERGTDVHLQAEPTKLELLHQEFAVKKDDFKANQKGSVLERVRTNKHYMPCFFFVFFFELPVILMEFH